MGALAARLGIRRPVRLLESARVQVPVVIGALRPVLLLPASALTGLAPAQVEAVLAHELAHIRRHDYPVNLLQSAAETLLFYHPGVWWLSARIRAEREHCCDDIAVRVCGDAVGYAEALTSIATWARQRREGNRGGIAAPFAVAAYIVAGYWFTSSTSFANPAVTFGRAFTDTYGGVRLAEVGGFVLVEVIGAGLALAVFSWLVPARRAFEAGEAPTKSGGN